MMLTITQAETIIRALSEANREQEATIAKLRAEAIAEITDAPKPSGPSGWVFGPERSDSALDGDWHASLIETMRRLKAEADKAAEGSGGDPVSHEDAAANRQQETIERLRESIKRLRERVAELEAETKRRLHVIDVKELDLGDAQEEIARLVAYIDDLQGKLATTAAELDRIRREDTNIRHALKEAHVTIDGLRKVNHNLQVSIADLTAARGRAIGERDHWRDLFAAREARPYLTHLSDPWDGAQAVQPRLHAPDGVLRRETSAADHLAGTGTTTTSEGAAA